MKPRLAPRLAFSLMLVAPACARYPGVDVRPVDSVQSAGGAQAGSARPVAGAPPNYELLGANLRAKIERGVVREMNHVTARTELFRCIADAGKAIDAWDAADRTTPEDAETAYLIFLASVRKLCEQIGN